MRRLVIITDQEPHVKQLLNSWEVASGRIEGEVLTVKMRNKATLVIEAMDPQMVADIVMSHDPGSEIVTGRLGIKSVVFNEPVIDQADEADVKAQLLQVFKKLLEERGS